MIHHLRNKLFRTLLDRTSNISISEFNFFGSDQTTINEECGIIFQGPIRGPKLLMHGLTNYRRIFPSAKIILSTWDIPDHLRKEIHSLGVELVLPNPPNFPGILGVNNQIVGVSSALELLNNLISEDRLVVKTRTDFFPRNPVNIFKIIKFFESILDCKRLWAVDIGTKKYIPYAISDILNCGRLKIMKNYWCSAGLSTANIGRKSFYKLTERSQNLQKIIELGCPEVYLATRYLSNNRVAYDVSDLDMYRKALVDYFGIIDANQVGLAFDKYSMFRSGQHIAECKTNISISFAEWLGMLTSKSS